MSAKPSDKRSSADEDPKGAAATSSSADAARLSAETTAPLQPALGLLRFKIVGALVVFALLYLFLVSISLLGAGFGLFGRDFAETLISTTSNPFIGLFIGLMATAIIQSSSTVTSMVVAFVAAGTLTVESAVPIVMGSNIGTSVTSMLVAMAHVQRRGEFRRAFSAATVHDFFNILTVALLLPIELSTHFLQRTAEGLTSALFGSASITFKSPIKLATEPVVGVVKDVVGSWPSVLSGTAVVVLAFVMLAISLYYLSKVIKLLLIHKMEAFFRTTVGKSGLLGMLMGLVITALVQSSSVTTSLMIPMAAAGAVTLRQVFPIALGANIGTTVTALLASMVGNAAGLTIALTHTLFNVIGVLLIYPFEPIRRIPIRLAQAMGDIGSRDPRLAVAFLLGIFFVLPGIMILIYHLM